MTTGIDADRWSALGAFFSRSLLVFQEPIRRELEAEWRHITEAERNLDDRLSVGLVGGTGVGKSTLINALAGSEISSAGDRRPTTDRVVVYRHGATPLPETLPREGIAAPEVLHQTRDLERVVLLDFPDFDSVEELHHEILKRFQPHLDVLIVLADDVKYADARLFDLLRRLPQSGANLHPVLNKVDRLELRYPGRWREVAREILDDFAEKLRVHAGLQVDRARLLAISARSAFLRASNGSAGDFPALVRLLEDYRSEKRRRAAKELNLEARKLALLQRARAAGLDEDALRRIDAGEAVLAARKTDLAGALAGTPAGVFTRSERRGIVAATLARSARAFGFPLDLILTSFGHLRLIRGRRTHPGTRAELTTARAVEHYRGYLEAVDNGARALRAEVNDVLPQLAAPASADAQAVLDPGDGLQQRVSAAEDALRRRSKVWNHALPAAVVLLHLWAILYPALRTMVGEPAGAGGSWRGALRDLFSSAFASLSPSAILGFVGSVLASYLLAAALAWMRNVQRLEGAVSDAEDALREKARRMGDEFIDASEQTIARWRAERKELAGLLGSESGERAERDRGSPGGDAAGSASSIRQ